MFVAVDRARAERLSASLARRPWGSDSPLLSVSLPSHPVAALTLNIVIDQQLHTVPLRSLIPVLERESPEGTDFCSEGGCGAGCGRIRTGSAFPEYRATTEGVSVRDARYRRDKRGSPDKGEN